MHKGIRHKTRKNKGLKRRKSLKGGMGASEYVSSMYGDLATQTANASQHMQLTPIHQVAPAPAPAPAQSGGKSKRKGKKGKKGGLRVPRQESSSRLAGGSHIPTENGPSRLAGGDEEEDSVGGGYFPLSPAEYSNAPMSDGQKGGYITQLLERAAVPFGLMAIQNYAGKRSRKHRK